MVALAAAAHGQIGLQGSNGRIRQIRRPALLSLALADHKLAMDQIQVSLSALSAPIPASLAAQVSGVLDGTGGGRLRVKYSSGTIDNVWQNNAPFSGSQTAVGDFTTPAGVTSFQVGTAVVLDRGHLTFSDVTLTAYSEVVAVTSSDLYQLDFQVSGAVSGGLGQSGRVLIYHENVSFPFFAWHNAPNFNGTLNIQYQFVAPSVSPTFRVALEVNLDAGHLAFSNFALQHQVETASTIERRSYTLGGQAIATRVTGDPQSGNNGLFYIHADHLGSTSLLTRSNGTVVPGSDARYLPFGGWRSEPTAGLTDRGYTGHKSNNLGNNDLGLIFMNARYYSPGLGRFISADTIVPDPTNPQQYNRYAYVLNNPLRFSDPSGHFTEEAIWNHIYGDLCYGSASCATDMMSNWRSNERWWGMLLAAQAGDVLFGTSMGEFAATFSGEGNTSLRGIFLSDPYGNPLASDETLPGLPYNLNLETIRHGVYRDTRYDRVGRYISATGFIRWDENGKRITGVYGMSGDKQYVPRGQWVRDGISSAFSFGMGALGALVPVGRAGSALIRYLPNAVTAGTLSVSSTAVSNAWLANNGLLENDVLVYIAPHRIIVNRGPERDIIRSYGR